MNKKELRNKYLTLRQQLDVVEVQQKSQQICERLMEAISQWQPKNVHVFLPIANKKEVSLQWLINRLQEENRIKVITSRTNWERMEMENLELHSSTELQVNKWGVPEPVGDEFIAAQEMDVVIVPLLAYDTLGHRVGYGKGFYDQFLTKCKKEVIKAGVSFYAPEAQISDIFEGDVALDYCFTPAEVYYFRQV